MSLQLYFGERVNFAWCYEMEPTETPVGQRCAHCGEMVKDGENGVVSPMGRMVAGELTATEEPWHVECWMRSLMGSAAHIARRCSCYVPGASESDDPNLTRRQAAIVAYEMVLLNRNVS